MKCVRLKSRLSPCFSNNLTNWLTRVFTNVVNVMWPCVSQKHSHKRKFLSIGMPFYLRQIVRLSDYTSNSLIYKEKHNLTNFLLRGHGVRFVRLLVRLPSRSNAINDLRECCLFIVQNGLISTGLTSGRGRTPVSSWLLCCFEFCVDIVSDSFIDLDRPDIIQIRGSIWVILA